MYGEFILSENGWLEGVLQEGVEEINLSEEIKPVYICGAYFPNKCITIYCINLFQATNKSYVLSAKYSENSFVGVKTIEGAFDSMKATGECNISISDNKIDPFDYLEKIHKAKSTLDFRDTYKIDLGLKGIQEIEKKDFHSDNESDNLCQNIFTKRFRTLRRLRPYRQ